MIRPLVVASFIAMLSVSNAYANDAANCEYFAQFIIGIKNVHDKGTPKAAALQWARQKGKADRLDQATTDLFVGEAIDAYSDKPKYVGSPAQVHDKAYAACIDDKLP